MLKIDLKLDTRFDYSGTLFEGLQVTARENVRRDGGPSDDFVKMLDEALGMKPDRDQAMVHRSYQISDRRCNPISRSWTLDELVAQLEQIASFGPIGEHPVEDYAAFSIKRSRPEDAVVRVEYGGVRLNDWFVQPVYRVGEFDSLLPALAGLKAIQAYLADLWSAQE